METLRNRNHSAQGPKEGGHLADQGGYSRTVKKSRGRECSIEVADVESTGHGDSTTRSLVKHERSLADSVIPAEVSSTGAGQALRRPHEAAAALWRLRSLDEGRLSEQQVALQVVRAFSLVCKPCRRNQCL